MGTGEGSSEFGTSATLVAFVNTDTLTMDSRFCLGVRGGVNFPPKGTSSGPPGIIVGGFDWEFVPGAAFFTGPTMGPVTALISTKASAPTDLIGLVFPLSDYSNLNSFGSSLDSAMTGIAAGSLSGDTMLGYTWCGSVFN